MILRKVLHAAGFFKEFILSEIERIISVKIQHVSIPRQALEQWIRELNELPPVRGRVAITAFRNKTWIEWAIYCAAVIRKMGFESTIIYKGSEIIRLYNGISYFNFWKGINALPGLECIDIDRLSYDDSDFQKYLLACEKTSIAALAYDFHVESSDIIEKPEKYKKDLKELQNQTARNSARLYKYFKKEIHHQFICYSGLISDTSTIIKAATDASQSVACVEGWAWRPGHMIYNFNSPALEYNLKGWMSYLGNWNQEKETEMIKYFSFLNGLPQDSDWLKDFYSVQKATILEELNPNLKEFLQGDQKVFLIPCNVIGDSSLLNRETIFKSHRDFVRKTIEYFSVRPNIKLIIRAHPGEDLVKNKVAIKMGDFASSLSLNYSNIIVIHSHEKINTFSLVPFINAGIVWITSAGPDLVARGIPVIAAAMPKYSGLRIVEEPSSLGEYFSLIDHLAHNDVYPNQEQIRKAKEYLYLIFKGFSFAAHGKNFRAITCKLSNMPDQEDHDRFYRILLGLEKSPV